MLQEKVTIISDILGEYTRSNKEFLFYCPFCKHHKKKLSINLEKDKWKCWICNSSGKTISYLVKKFGDSQSRQSWSKFDSLIDISDFEETLDFIFEHGEEKQETKIDLPKEYVSLNNKNPSLSGMVAKHYLRHRDIMEKHILKYSIGYCAAGEYAGRIVIPSFDENGDINYFISRTYEKHFIKYKNPPLNKSKIIFNELFLDFTEPITVVEGVFDAIIAGDNSVPLLGSSLSTDSKLFKRIIENQTSVYLCLDLDAKEKQFTIAEKLIKYGVEVNIVDIGNAKDVGSMSSEEFLECKQQASSFTNDNKIFNLLTGSL
jgi:DNA primase